MTRKELQTLLKTGKKDKEMAERGGIRTPGTLSGTHAFQACTFSLSVISPHKRHFTGGCFKIAGLSQLEQIDFINKLLSDIHGLFPGKIKALSYLYLIRCVNGLF